MRVFAEEIYGIPPEQVDRLEREDALRRSRKAARSSSTGARAFDDREASRRTSSFTSDDDRCCVRQARRRPRDARYAKAGTALASRCSCTRRCRRIAYDRITSPPPGTDRARRLTVVGCLHGRPRRVDVPHMSPIDAQRLCTHCPGRRASGSRGLTARKRSRLQDEFSFRYGRAQGWLPLRLRSCQQQCGLQGSRDTNRKRRRNLHARPECPFLPGRSAGLRMERPVLRSDDEPGPHRRDRVVRHPDADPKNADELRPVDVGQPWVGDGERLSPFSSFGRLDERARPLGSRRRRRHGCLDVAPQVRLPGRRRPDADPQRASRSSATCGATSRLRLILDDRTCRALGFDVQARLAPRTVTFPCIHHRERRSRARREGGRGGRCDDAARTFQRCAAHGRGRGTSEQCT